MQFLNNIVYKLNTVAWFPPDGSGVYDHNIIYGNHSDREPSDANKITADPLFVQPGSGGDGIASVDGYKLQSGSPALNSGEVVDESYAPHNGNGGLDYWGNAVSSSEDPDRGAYNGTAIVEISGTSLTNPGFETGSLSPWANSGNATVVNYDAHSGTYAANIGTSYTGVNRVVTNLLPDTTYTLTASVKNSVAGDATYVGSRAMGAPRRTSIPPPPPIRP